MWKLLASVVLFAFVESASAQDNSSPVRWKNVGGWSVFADRSNGNACFTATVYESGIVLRVGYNGNEADADTYVAIGNSEWKSIEIGKEYDLSFQMDREPPWNGTATGWTIGDTPYLVINHDSYDFFSEFARKLGMRIYYDGKLLAHLSLRGSHAALLAMIDCQQVVDKYLTEPRKKDPFEEPNNDNATDKDPFT